MRRPPRAQPRLEHTASRVQRLSVLLSAGIAPGSAWLYVDEEIGALARQGITVVDALARRDLPWRVVGAAWDVATHAGAPVAPALASFAVSLRELAQAERQIATALSGPIATARLVTVLPVIGLFFGALLGFDSIRVLLTTPVGIASGAVGLALLAVAALWNRRLVASARPRDVTAGVEAELMAIALAGGASIDRAANAVSLAVHRARLPIALNDESVREALELSRRAGVPASDLLRSTADEARREAAAAALRKAETLAVKLVIPLGICILPAFMLLGVAPLLISVISSTVGTL